MTDTRSATTPDDPSTPSSALTPLALVNLVLRHRGLLLLGALAAAIPVAVLGLRTPRSYASSASFVPQARRGASPIAGIASQFGISVPAGDAAESPQFYADLLQSREVLRTVAETRFQVDTGTGRPISFTLVDLYGAEESTPAARLDAAMTRLAKTTGASVSPKTGIIGMRVIAPYPTLAQAIAAREVELLNEFNLRRRQTQASAERRFTENRLAEVGAELRVAESTLQSFLASNRAYEDGSSLRLTNERLEREVSRVQQLYNSLSQAYEQAKIDEVRDTPVITLIDRPEAPLRPESREIAKRTGFALLIGAIVGLLIGIAADARARRRGRPSRADVEFEQLWRESLRDVVQPWRPVRRWLGRRQRPA